MTEQERAEALVKTIKAGMPWPEPGDGGWHWRMPSVRSMENARKALSELTQRITDLTRELHEIKRREQDGAANMARQLLDVEAQVADLTRENARLVEHNNETVRVAIKNRDGRVAAEAQLVACREALRYLSLADGANAPAGMPTAEYLRQYARRALSDGPNDAAPPE